MVVVVEVADGSNETMICCEVEVGMTIGEEEDVVVMIVTFAGVALVGVEIVASVIELLGDVMISGEVEIIDVEVIGF